MTVWNQDLSQFGRKIKTEKLVPQDFRRNLVNKSSGRNETVGLGKYKYDQVKFFPCPFSFNFDPKLPNKGVWESMSQTNVDLCLQQSVTYGGHLKLSGIMIEHMLY